MKEQVKRLNSVLNLKQKLLDKLVSELEILKNTEIQLKNTITNLKNKLNSLNITIGSEVTPDDFFMLENNRHFFELKIRVAEEELDSILVRKKQKQDEVILANQELKGIEKILEKKKQLLEQELRKKERKELDDMVSTRRSR